MSKWDKDTASSAAAAAAAALKERLAATGKIVSAPPPPQTAPPGIPGIVGGAQELNAEIEINDNPQRVILTRGPKQEELMAMFGVTITTRGRFYSQAEKATRSSASEKPLHLYIEAKDQGSLDKAKSAINEVLSAQPTPLRNERRLATSKVWIDIYLPAGSTFDLRGKITGPDNSYLNHIAHETGCKVLLRGRGSGTIEATTGQESTEQLHVFLEHMDRQAINSARSLCENLVKTIRQDYNAFLDEEKKKKQQQAAPPQAYGAYPGYGMPPYYNQAYQYGYPQAAYGGYGQYPGYGSSQPAATTQYPPSMPPGYGGQPVYSGQPAQTAPTQQQGAAQQAQWTNSQYPAAVQPAAPAPGATYGPTAAAVPPTAAPPPPPDEPAPAPASVPPAQVPDLPPAKRKFSEKAPSAAAPPVPTTHQPKKQKVSSLVDYADDE